jgi:hypothetical protein
MGHSLGVSHGTGLCTRDRWDAWDTRDASGHAGQRRTGPAPAGQSADRGGAACAHSLRRPGVVGIVNPLSQMDDPLQGAALPLIKRNGPLPSVPTVFTDSPSCRNLSHGCDRKPCSGLKYSRIKHLTFISPVARSNATVSQCDSLPTLHRFGSTVGVGPKYHP